MAEPSSRVVLISALLLPGFGHTLLGNGKRGLTFLFFILVFGWLSHHLMPAHASFIGRNIGAIFVYGLSVIDAYRAARLRDIQKP